MARNDEELLGMIEVIRTENNIHWMNILRLAFRHAPKESKELMKRISECDKQINQITEELSNG